MNIAIVNAYILWKASNRPLPGNKRQHGLEFFKGELVLNLCDPAIAMRNRRVPPPTQQPEALYTVQTDVVVGHAHVCFDGRKKCASPAEGKADRRHRADQSKHVNKWKYICQTIFFIFF